MPNVLANAKRLLASIEEATAVRNPTSDSRRARFSVGLRPGQTLQDMTPIIVAALAVFDPLVTPLSELDDRTLVITLRNRLFLQEPEKMFEAAYAMADSFALEFAEPEVLTHVIPVPDPARRGPATESIDDFPPGCWAPQEPNLDKRRL